MSTVFEPRVSGEAANSSRWLITFADLVALLLVFFVLLFSMKEIDRDRWEELTGSFQGVFSPRDAVVWQRPDNFFNAEKRNTYVANDALMYLNKLFVQRMKDDAVWSTVEGVLAEDGGELYLPMPRALAAAGVEADDETKDALARLAGLVRNWDNRLSLRVVQPLDGMTAPFAAAVMMQGELVRQGVALKQAAWWPPEAGMPAGTWLVVGGPE
ncbi:MAG: hypothetical protein H6922_02720 [Pseudomonadaceae bacterium]|nr:hypothetical protein [Pseudomonadaceae bacterium]